MEGEEEWREMVSLNLPFLSLNHWQKQNLLQESKPMVLKHRNREKTDGFLRERERDGLENLGLMMVLIGERILSQWIATIIFGTWFGIVVCRLFIILGFLALLFLFNFFFVLRKRRHPFLNQKAFLFSHYVAVLLLQK